MTETELLNIFPEGRKFLIKKAQRIILECEFWLRYDSKELQRIQNEMVDTPWEQMWIKELWIELNTVERSRLNKIISQQIWRVRMLKGQAKPSSKGITDEDIYQAKHVPISSLYNTGKLRKVGNRFIGKCPFHTEKSGSFVIYTAQNSWWCYGCSSGGSSVDYIMKLNNIPFIEAIKILIHV